MPGVLGLITDFGDSVYDGIVEAVVTSFDQAIKVVRLDTRVPPFSALAGSYITYSSYRWLPPGSALVVVVDPGVGTSRRAVIVETRNYHMVAPDNGVIYEAAVEDGVNGVYVIDAVSLRREASRHVGPFLSHPPSSTFHGRDLFAPAAALLLRGLRPDSIARPAAPDSLVRLRLRSVVREGARLRLRVVYIDHFGNVALSATPRDLSLRPWSSVRLTKGEVSVTARVARTFGDVRPGEWVMYVNSFGFWEVAVNQGVASSLLGAGVGDRLELEVVH